MDCRDAVYVLSIVVVNIIKSILQSLALKNSVNQPYFATIRRVSCCLWGMLLDSVDAVNYVCYYISKVAVYQFFAAFNNRDNANDS